MFSRGYTHDYPLQSLVKNHQWSTAHRSDGSPLPEMAGKSSKKGGCLRGKSSIKMGNFPLHVWLPEGTWDSHQIIACLTCFLLEKIRIRHWIDMMEKNNNQHETSRLLILWNSVWPRSTDLSSEFAAGFFFDPSQLFLSFLSLREAKNLTGGFKLTRWFQTIISNIIKHLSPLTTINHHQTTIFPPANLGPLKFHPSQGFKQSVCRSKLWPSDLDGRKKARITA